VDEEGDEDPEKRQKEEEDKRRKKLKKKKNDIKLSGEEEPIEDLPLKEIIQQVQEGNHLNPVRGLVIVGQPMTEEQVQMLKYHAIPVDKVVVLLDKDEEEPGKTLSKRENF